MKQLIMGHAVAIAVLCAAHAGAQQEVSPPVHAEDHAAQHSGHGQGAAPQEHAQHEQPPEHDEHPAPLEPADAGDMQPPLPEGMSLDDMLDYGAKPPPSSWPSPIDDNAIFSFTQIEILEYRFTDKGRDALGWDANGWIGNDDHKLWWKTEGDVVLDGPDEGAFDVQALYATPISPFWYLQAGVQFELDWEPGSTDEGVAAVLGVQGTAPFQWDVEPALFLTDDGDLLGQLTASYNLYITQRLILQPRLELFGSAQDVPERGLGAGLTSGNFDLRLLYEHRREFAPYVGVRYQTLFGETADMATRDGREEDDLQFVLGVRISF